MIWEHFPILIPIPLLLGAMIAAPIGVWKRHLSYPIALTAIGISLFSAISGLVFVLNTGTHNYYLGGWVPPIGIEYVVDSLSAFVSVIVVGAGFLVMIYSHKSLQKELPNKEVAFHSVALLFLAGLSGMVVTGDLFNLYVFLEIASLSAYALVSVGEKRAPVAAFRYLLLGTIGATFYLLGLGYLYLVTGSLNMADTAKIIPHLQETGLVLVALTLMIVGIGLKMAMFPLHLWLPDAYTYAPSVGSAYLAPIATKVSAYVLIRILFTVFQPTFVSDKFPVTDVIAWLSVVGIVWGSVMAMAQKDLKRMLAYSSVSQIGYIGLGIGLANPLGFIGAVLHILNHAVMKGTLFLVSGNLYYRFSEASIPEFDSSLRKKMPWTTAAFTIAALSMIGIPPTAGFFSKWYLVLGSISANNWIFVFVIGLSSLLNVIYFFRILEKMYLKKSSPENNDVKMKEAPASMLIPTLIFALAVIVFGLLNAFIVDYIIKLATPQGF
ncbi:MAG: monovalent cation/H+ antiporter subunit D family protein [Bacteroidota bacterium]|nr:monovalent cation/H+ antiporter subunit D family protein [Bacteroidota bacterium]